MTTNLCEPINQYETMLVELIDDLKLARLELQETNQILTETYHNCMAYCAGRGGCLLCPIKRGGAECSTIKSIRKRGNIIEMFPKKKK